MEPCGGAAAVVQESALDHPWHVTRPQAMSRSNSNTFTDENKPVHAARSIRTDNLGLSRLNSSASNDVSNSSSPRTPQGDGDSADFSDSDATRGMGKPSRLGQLAASLSGPATPDMPPPAPRKPMVSPPSLPPKQPGRQRPGSSASSTPVANTPSPSAKANFDLLKRVKTAAPGSPLAEISTEISKEAVMAVKEARSKAKGQLARISPPVGESNAPKPASLSRRRNTMDAGQPSPISGSSAATSSKAVQESTSGNETPGTVASTEATTSTHRQSDSTGTMSRHVHFEAKQQCSSADSSFTLRDSPDNSSARSSMMMRCSGIGMLLQQDDQSPVPSKAVTETPDAEEEAYSLSKHTEGHESRSLPGGWDAVTRASAALVNRVNTTKSLKTLKVTSLDSAALIDAAERSLSLKKSKSTPRHCYRSSDSAAIDMVSDPVDDEPSRRLSDEETQFMSPRAHQEPTSPKDLISDARTRALQRCASAKAAITRSRAKASAPLLEDVSDYSTPDKQGRGNHDGSQATPSPPEEPLTPELSTENAGAVYTNPESSQAHESLAAGVLQLTTAQKIKMMHLKAMWLDMEAACQASHSQAEQEELEQEMVLIQNKMLQICPSF